MAAPCSTDLDCQLNGICDGSTCRCDFGWRGASCGELALGESAVAVRYEPEPSAGGGWSCGPFARAGTSRDAMLFAAEDAVLWRDERRGAFHMLVHRFAGANGSTAGTEVGGHAWSVDALTWHYDYASVAYNSTVRWRNGSAGSVLYRRERPKPVVDAATGRVTYLLNGGWPCHEGAEDDDSLDGLAGCWSYTVGTEVVE